MAGIWRQVFPVNNQDGCACPTCSRAMTKATVEVQGSATTLDFCRVCEFAWFDAGEYEALPLAPLKPRVLGETDYPLLPTELRQRLAKLNASEITESARGEDPTSDAIWKAIPSALGLQDSRGSGRVPWATNFLSVAIGGISIAAFFHLQAVVELYGLIPDQVWRDDGLTWLTSFFLHESWLQLLGNLYFLLLLGRAVENAIGTWRLLLLVLVADQTGNLLQVLGDAQSDLPSIGASGAISGIITYYALVFPRARLGMLFNYGYQYWRWTQFPAWVVFLLWIGLQTLDAWELVSGFSNISALAHVGGVGAGVFFWWQWRQRYSWR